jgi:hypothetical protein
MARIEQFLRGFLMSHGKRMQLFEFMDQAWFPKLIRGFLTDIIEYHLTINNLYSPVAPKIKETLQKLHCRHVVDLCSGSTGPLLRIQEFLSDQGKDPVSITLTDKYPNINAFQKLSQLSKCPVDFVPTSVDATSVPSDYRGMRTLFSSFHHFRPDQAKRILQDAVDKNVPIGIFEFTERTRKKCLSALYYGPLITFQITPNLRPFKWSRFFWTYIMPVVPILYTWDTLVSYLRTYSIRELNQFVSEMKSAHYSWDIGQVRSESFGANITYLFGFNRQN